jgi:hypothetical protein
VQWRMPPYAALRQRTQVTDPAGGVRLAGKVSCNNWKMIDTALSGALISGAALPTSRPGVTTMLYTAPAPKAV